MDFWEIERELIAAGYKTICGVDEAGRGPLAGDVYAAAVILPFGIDIVNLNDSKKLSETKREELFDVIIDKAVSYAIASADCREIDELNILNATYLAMNRAIKALSPEPHISLIDGNRSSGITFMNKCIVGGDGKSASIAAASILAKVSRDRYMTEISAKYPEYAFEKHKGYGTKLHYEMLREYGPSDIHRATFLKKLSMEDGKWIITDSSSHTKSQLGDGRSEKRVGGERTNSRQRGKWGEAVALEYLEKKDFAIVATGFRSRFGEIDLIVKDNKFIVFVEVKCRKNSNFAHAREYVGKEKQKKIIATANFWLSARKSRLQPRFDVIEIYAPDGENTHLPEIIHIENAF